MRIHTPKRALKQKGPDVGGRGKSTGSRKGCAERCALGTDTSCNAFWSTVNVVSARVYGLGFAFAREVHNLSAQAGGTEKETHQIQTLSRK